MAIEVHTDVPGILVLSDVYYPGWQARVNDRKAEILPAYSDLRGVVVPERFSRVVMDYSSAWLCGSSDAPGPSALIGRFDPTEP